MPPRQQAPSEPMYNNYVGDTEDNHRKMHRTYLVVAIITAAAIVIGAIAYIIAVADSNCYKACQRIGGDLDRALNCDCFDTCSAARYTECNLNEMTKRKACQCISLYLADKVRYDEVYNFWHPENGIRQSVNVVSNVSVGMVIPTVAPNFNTWVGSTNWNTGTWSSGSSWNTWTTSNVWTNWRVQPIFFYGNDQYWPSLRRLMYTFSAWESWTAPQTQQQQSTWNNAQSWTSWNVNSGLIWINGAWSTAGTNWGVFNSWTVGK